MKEIQNLIAQTAFKTYLFNSKDLIFVKDINLRYVTASESFIRMTGKSTLSDIVGKSDFDIFENQELARRYTADDRTLFEGGIDLVDYIEPITDENGISRYSSTSKYILKDERGEVIGLLGVSVDITQQYLAQQRHQQELQYLFELPEDTYAALFMDIDDWRIVQHRRSTTGEHVLAIRENMDEFASNALNCLADPEDTYAHDFYRKLSKQTMLELCRNGVRYHSLEYLRYMANDEKIWVLVEINFLIDPGTGHLCAMWTMKDVNAIKQATEQLRDAAEHDQMTGVYNRAHTLESINAVLEQDATAQHALIILDVDHLKYLNDTKGHQAGDDFLIAFARALRQSFRDTDIVGRIGGDEFFVLMKNITNSKSAAEKADAVFSTCRQVCRNYESEKLSVSAGISFFPQDGTTLDQLYSKADAALYMAKRGGKNRFFVTCNY